MASQLRSMTRRTLSDGEGSVLSDGSHAGAERKRVRETVLDVYDKVLGRKPDPGQDGITDTGWYQGLGLRA